MCGRGNHRGLNQLTQGEAVGPARPVRVSAKVSCPLTWRMCRNPAKLGQDSVREPLIHPQGCTGGWTHTLLIIAVHAAPGQGRGYRDSQGAVLPPATKMLCSPVQVTCLRLNEFYQEIQVLARGGFGEGGLRRVTVRSPARDPADLTSGKAQLDRGGAFLASWAESREGRGLPNVSSFTRGWRPHPGTRLSLSREVAGREPGTHREALGVWPGRNTYTRYPVPGQSSTETDR